MEIHYCRQCDKKIIKPARESYKNWAKHNFCSIKCKNTYKKGKPFKHSKQFQKGIIAWNKGKKTGLIPKSAFKKGAKPHNAGAKGIFHHSEETRLKIKESSLGRKHTEESRLKMSLLNKGSHGSNWKGGITPENRKIRSNLEFKLWRESVFARDNYTCQKCKAKGGYLHPHHIFNFATHLDLRFAIDNGITLCKKCHMQFHKKYGNRNNTKEQLIEFLNN